MKYMPLSVPCLFIHALMRIITPVRLSKHQLYRGFVALKQSAFFCNRLFIYIREQT